MFSQQPLPKKNQITQKTQLNLTQLTLIDPNCMPKKSNIPPIEDISGGKLPNLVSDWMISVDDSRQVTTKDYIYCRFVLTHVSTLQAFNVKTKVKKHIGKTLTYTRENRKDTLNGAQYADVRGFGDWIVVTIYNYTNGTNVFSIQTYHIQTGEKKDFVTTTEKYNNITITALNDVWGVMVCTKASPTEFGFGFEAPDVQQTLILFNVQTGAIKTLSTNNKKNISLNYRASFHPAIISYQDDTGMHIFDYEQGKELKILPEQVEEIPTIKPTTKDYLESISKADPSVESIVAGDLQLGDVLVTTLINALPDLKALQRLDLRGNKLTDESAKYLYMAAQKHPKLLEIQLDNNAISADWQQAIAERLKRNQPKPATVQAKKLVEAPHEYSCPLSLSIMLDPVMASDGETYEREEIEKWMRKNNTSPITRAPLTNNLLTPNKSIKKLIQDFLDANPDLRESDKLYLSDRLITQCVNAIKTRDSQALLQALDQDTRLLTVGLENDQTLLLLACQQECPTILKIVINRLLQQNRWSQAMNATKRSEWQLFHLTIKHTALEGAKLLTQALGWSWVDLEQLLFNCDFKGTILFAEILIRLGAPLHHWNAEGQTPLHYAVTIENIELIKLLVELGADTKALNADQQRPGELALALGKPELALAIEAQKQQRKLAWVMQPLLISLQQQSEQISLLQQSEQMLQEENKLLHQCLATMVAGMSAASNNTTDLSKHLIQSFLQFGQHSTGLKSQVSSNNPSVSQDKATNTTGSFFQAAPKKSVTPVVVDSVTRENTF